MIEDILTQIGSTTVVIAIAAYIAKTWVTHQMKKLSAQNSHELARQIAKLNVHEPYLHKRRVEVIEAIYKKTLNAEFSLKNFLVTWWGYSNREGLTASAFSENEECSSKRGAEFCAEFVAINAMLHNNALYFDEHFIDGVRNAYKPFFDEIVNFEQTNPPPFPDAYLDIIAIGEEPRQSVISLFRRALGVEGQE